MLQKLFSSTAKLTKFMLKREIVSSTLWIVCLLALTLGVAAVFPSLMPEGVERQSLIEMMKSPAMIAMLGPAYGTDNYTNGAMMSNMMLLFTIIGVAIMNIFLVIKHTRRDEEEGRLELIRSLPVGKLANLLSTIIVAVIVNMILTVLIGIGLYALKLDSMNLIGSLTYASAIGVSGILFAGITALFVQLASTARAATGYSFAFLGLAYLLQAGGEVLSYISPLGLILKVQAYVENFWWPIFAVKGIFLVVLLIAFILNQTRDLGEGIIAAKPGRKTAKKSLLSPFGLSIKLTKNIFIAWAISLFILGASYGSVMGDLESFIESNDFFKQMLSATGSNLPLVEQFIAMLMSIMAVVACIPTLTMMLKIHNEEKKGRNENIYARNVSKTKYLSGYFIISIVTSIVMISFVAMGMWSAAYSTMDNPIAIGTVLKAGLVYIPAIWIMIGIVLLLISYVPKYTGLIWFYLGFTGFAIYIGKMIQLPEWLVKLSPYGYVPQIPAQEMNWTNLSMLFIGAVVFISIGFIKYKKREMSI